MAIPIITSDRNSVAVATQPESVPARPFLKWAGGKRQLLAQLRRFVPDRFGCYFEPFVGSGALFFDLANAGRVDDGARLTDVNHDLVGCYRAIAADVDGVIAALQRHHAMHGRAPAEYYYRVRDEKFNPTRRRIFENGAAEREDFQYPAALAAMFIYLNRTGFNGLYRLNSRGDFNVPVGRYTNPQICDAANLRAVSAVLASAAVDVQHGSFTAVTDQARPGDLLYFDPPYEPLTATANFTSYTASGFSAPDQRQLRELVVDLAARGCHVIVSNSTAPLISQLYDHNRAARRAGLRAHRVPARRAINSNATLRGTIDEYIISNVTPSAWIGGQSNRGFERRRPTWQSCGAGLQAGSDRTKVGLPPEARFRA